MQSRCSGRQSEGQRLCLAQELAALHLSATASPSGILGDTAGVGALRQLTTAYVCSTVPSLFKTRLDKVATQENTTQHKLLRSPSKESVTVNDCYILNPPANGLAVI